MSSNLSKYRPERSCRPETVQVCTPAQYQTMINITGFKIQTYADLDDAILYPNLSGEEKHVLFLYMGFQGCMICRNTSNLSLDHVIPDIRGGTYNLWNTIILCRNCNAKKRERPLRELDAYGEFSITAAVRSVIATRGRNGEKDIGFPMDMDRNPGFYTFVKQRIEHCQYARPRVELGNFLLKRRHALGISRDFMQAAMSCGYDTIGRWERGVKVPSELYLHRYLELLKVSFENVRELYEKAVDSRGRSRETPKRKPEFFYLPNYTRVTLIDSEADRHACLQTFGVSHFFAKENGLFVNTVPEKVARYPKNEEERQEMLNQPYIQKFITAGNS